METSSNDNRPIDSSAASAAAAVASSSSEVTGSYAHVPVNLWSDGCRIADDDFNPWNSDSPLYPSEDAMPQHSDVRTEEAYKVPLVGDQEPLSSLEAEYEHGSPILQEKIKLLGEQYNALRRTKGDGNCFFRGFMFSYLEHIVETQDKAEVERITACVEESKRTLQNLGYPDFTYEDFFTLFLEQLEYALEGEGSSSSHETLLERSRDQSTSDCVVMFFRFVTAGEIRKRSEFFEPFILGLTNSTVDQFCKSSVEPMGEESDHVHITALTDALSVPIRVMYLDRSSCDTGPLTINHHDFIPISNAPKEEGTPEPGRVSDAGPKPKPLVTLLYRPGHYDILYSK